MGFTVYYPGKKVELYAKLGESNCINLDSKFDKATTTNTVSIRPVFSIEVFLENTDGRFILKIKTATTSELDFSGSTITENVIFNIYVYLKNIFLVLIGILILISTCIQSIHLL